MIPSRSLLIATLLLQATTASAACKSTPGSEQIWSNKTVQWLFIGELHGSNEMPAEFGQLVCEALAQGKDVTVALERPTSEQVALSAMLSSPDLSAAKKALLDQPDWKQGMDGRASNAMLSLLVYLRNLHRSYPTLAVAAFEAPSAQTSPGARDEAMGTKLLSLGADRPNNLILVLTGNVHGMEAPMFGYDFAAMYIPPERRLSLQVTDKGGSSWANVRGACGPQKGATGDKGAGKPFGIYLDSSLAPYGKVDGVLSLAVPLTSSAPAAGDPSTLPECRVKFMSARRLSWGKPNNSYIRPPAEISVKIHHRASSPERSSGGKPHRRPTRLHRRHRTADLVGCSPSQVKRIWANPFRQF